MNDSTHNWIPFRGRDGRHYHDTCSVCGCIRVFTLGRNMHKYKGVSEIHYRLRCLTCEDQQVYDVLTT